METGIFNFCLRQLRFTATPFMAILKYRVPADSVYHDNRLAYKHNESLLLNG